MYQLSMFDGSVRGAKYLGSGVNASVHDTGDGWVVKRARERDGTLNWLEFCKHMQDAGEHMPGMPIIDRLVKTEQGYVVTMKRYDSLREDTGFPGFDSVRNGDIRMERLCAAYVDYANENFELGEFRSVYGVYDLFNDCHRGNVMVDDPTGECEYIITDPDCGSYHEPRRPEEFTLQ